MKRYRTERGEAFEVKPMGYCRACGLALSPARQNPYCSRCWQEINGIPNRPKDLWFAVTFLAVVLALAVGVIIAGVAGL